MSLWQQLSKFRKESEFWFQVILNTSEKFLFKKISLIFSLLRILIVRHWIELSRHFLRLREGFFERNLLPYAQDTIWPYVLVNLDPLNSPSKNPLILYGYQRLTSNSNAFFKYPLGNWLSFWFWLFMQLSTVCSWMVRSSGGIVFQPNIFEIAFCRFLFCNLRKTPPSLCFLCLPDRARYLNLSKSSSE